MKSVGRAFDIGNVKPMGKYSSTLSKRLRHKQHELLPNRQNASFWDRPQNLNFTKMRFEEKYSREQWRYLKQGENLNQQEADTDYDTNCSMENWFSPDYWVALDKTCRYAQMYRTFQDHPLWHLMICRMDDAPCRDWTIFQAIKNEIIGPEYEAIELYPAQSRLMDVFNKYHLWVLAPKDDEELPPRFPFGCRHRGLRTSEPLIVLVPERCLAEHRQEMRETMDRQPVDMFIFPEALRPEVEKEFPGMEYVDAIRKYFLKHPETEVQPFEP